MLERECGVGLRKKENTVGLHIGTGVFDHVYKTSMAHIVKTTMAHRGKTAMAHTGKVTMTHCCSFIITTLAHEDQFVKSIQTGILEIEGQLGLSPSPNFSTSTLHKTEDSTPASVDRREYRNKYSSHPMLERDEKGLAVVGPRFGMIVEL